MLDGFIDTTRRASVNNNLGTVVSIELAPSERAEAERRRGEYGDRLAREFADQRERQRREHERLEEEWIRLIGFRVPERPTSGRRREPRNKQSPQDPELARAAKRAKRDPEAARAARRARTRAWKRANPDKVREHKRRAHERRMAKG